MFTSKIGVVVHNLPCLRFSRRQKVQEAILLRQIIVACGCAYPSGKNNDFVNKVYYNIYLRSWISLF